MQKNFITFCFIMAIFPVLAVADVVPITGRTEINSPDAIQSNTPKIKLTDLPNPDNPQEVKEFFKKKFEDAVRMDTDKPIDLSSSSASDVVHSPEYYALQREKNKPLFQKMYEKALASLHDETKENDQDSHDSAVDDQTLETATRFFQLVRQKRHDEITEPQIPTVSVPLPSGRRILAPAQEHIPYLLSYIDIQTNGYLKVEDTITIVANDNEFAKGLVRIFPKYAKNSQKIELILDKVTVNNNEIPYTAEEIGTKIVLKPKYQQKLNPGVYTYRFNYLVNNKLYRVQDDDILLRWSLTGLPLNMFITSANAIVSVSNGGSFKNIAAYIGEKDIFTSNRMNAYKLAHNVFAFSSNTPVLNGESVEIIALLDKDVLFADFDKSFSAFLNNWGNVLYAVFGFITILISFLLSLSTLKKNNNSKGKFTPSYNGALMRSILIGKYDRIAFVSALLDIYRKNAIDIIDENGRIFLEKRAQGLSKLNKIERKIIAALFGRKIQKIEANNVNNKYFKRAYNILGKSVNRQLGKMKIVQNIGYLIFSIIMLILTLVFIAVISINTAQSLIILLSTTSLYAFYIWIWRHKFKHWYTTIIMKVLALLSLLLIWLFSSIYVGSLTSIVICATVYMIYVFATIFGTNNNFINEAKETVTRYKEYLIGNAESINLSNAFMMQQSNIFALSISEYFPQNISNQKSYKLDIAENLRRTLIGIL